MDIDSETAELIIDTYRKINSLKRILNDIPFQQVREFVESGNSIGDMMNNTLNGTSKEVIQKKLSSTAVHVQKILNNTSQKAIPGLYNNSDATAILNQLLNNINSLQSKIARLK